MPKLIIMRGLPASGKTTKAKELVEASGNAVRLNKDLLRTMLHFDKWTGRKEDQTFHAEQLLAKFFLGKGQNVIIDDTNLNPRVFEIWKEIHPDHEVITMGTPYSECVYRDRLREKPVGMAVIFAMARKYGQYSFVRPEVICDIDGTIANTDHRLHFLEGEKKNWKGFFEAAVNDTVNADVLERLMNHKKDGKDIIFVSGRPDTYAAPTMKWLYDNKIPCDGLLMRRAKDNRPDTVVKKEILDTFFKKEFIEEVIDDRPSVIRMWEENGLNVIDVGKGIEF